MTDEWHAGKTTTKEKDEKLRAKTHCLEGIVSTRKSE